MVKKYIRAGVIFCSTALALSTGLAMDIFPTAISTSTAYAMKQLVGELRQEDFSYKGIALLEEADVDKLEKLDDVYLFDSEMLYMGESVRRYMYDKDVIIYVSTETNKVVEIIVRNKKYIARDNVTYGALSYTLIKAYGHGVKKQIAGQECYLYESPQFPQMKFIVELDGENYYMTGIRMTTLPLDGSELFNKNIRESISADGWERDRPKFNFGVKK